MTQSGGRPGDSPKSTGLRESGLLDDFAPEILRCAQDDTMKKAVILSTAKDLLRAYGISPDSTAHSSCSMRAQMEALSEPGKRRFQIITLNHARYLQAIIPQIAHRIDI